MKWNRLLALIAFFGLYPLVLTVQAAPPDRYKGDTAIYSGASTELRPNVLFVIDTSKDMGQAGGVDPYDAPYTETEGGDAVFLNPYSDQGHETYRIYKKLNQGNYQDYLPAGVDINSAGFCAEARTSLLATGFYNKGINKQTGACSTTSNDYADYYLGNLLNKLNAPVIEPDVWTAETSFAVGDVVKPTDSSNTSTYRCTQAGTSGTSEPNWPTTAGSPAVDDGTAKWEITADLMTVVKEVLKQVSLPLSSDIKMGLMTFGDNNHGGWIQAEIKEMAATDTDGDANLLAFQNAVDGMEFLSTNTGQPVNETLWDAQLYFKGLNDTTDKFAAGAARFSADSPIEYSCQKNYVILLTTGSSTPSPQAEGAIGDQDEDSVHGTIMDAAKLLYETDAFPDDAAYEASEGVQRIQTNIIQLMTSKVDDLETATNGSHGRGAYYQANNTDDLIEALLDTLGNVVREAETAFVAPVVPASPENRTYSGKRIYIGFFKPISGEPWLGNLKKFAINSNNEIVSTDGETPATNSDGTFNAGATSFWSPSGDSGNVLVGGVGGKLKNRTTARNIYTYSGDSTKKLLTDTYNHFTTDNTASVLDADQLGVDSGDRDKLIKYVRGLDGYNDYGLGDTVKREWLLGDILHSKPLVVPFKKYTFSTENEADPNLNKTYIFQGTNDGMMHAFRDVDGEEAWAFIPPDLLPRLKHLRDSSHSYFVDSTASIYLHDANGDGNIVKADGDAAILIFGLRRGGGTNTLSDAGSHGAFYALDVSNPEAPEFLWKIDNQTTGFSELAQSWSQPKLVRLKIGTEKKVAMVIGAGYDNAEDLRFGSTQTYPDDTSMTYVTDDFTSGKSTGSNTAPQYPRGRGIYVIEIATLSGSPLVPSFTNSGTKIWGYTYGSSDTSSATGKTSPDMAFSISSDVFALDRDLNGYTDRLYVGDLGGNLWRFDVGNTSPANWTGKIIFSSNPGDDIDSTTGRKIFYKPDVTILDSQNAMIYFGTGDREHPQNYLNPGASGAAVDRMYAFRDNDATSTILTEEDLVDVTENVLQQDVDESLIEAERDRLLNDSSEYGWFIRLDQNDGEKVLAPASVFDKVAFFTTYQPHDIDTLDLVSNPCQPGNLGSSRLYAVNYRTGEAVYNFNGTNDTTPDNERALGVDKDGNEFTLRRSDREMSLGGGIPSGMVFIIGADGKVTTVTSADASFPALSLDGNGVIYPVYWLQW